MGIKINQYPLDRTIFGDDDYYDIDYWNGSTFETAKIKGSVIKAGISAGIISDNLFTADLTLLANRLHDIADKSIQFDISKATGNSGNFRITNNAIVGYLYDTQIPANLTTLNQQSDAIILTADGGASATVLSIVRGEGSLSNSNNGFSFNANTKLTIITGTNGDIQIGDPTNNTNTFYNDISTNLYGIILKGFGETSETDATGANYSTLVGTSLVPKKYVDDAIASTPASNISNSDLTFSADHYANLNSNSWTLGGTVPIGTEKISLQKNTLIKGSNTSPSTTGFKVVDSAGNSKFEVTNSGQITVTNTFSTIPTLKAYKNATGINHQAIEIRNSDQSSGANATIDFKFATGTTTWAQIKFTKFQAFDTGVELNNQQGSNVLVRKDYVAIQGSTQIGSEKISLQDDTLIKGSNNAVGTSGFKVTDINDNSLLDVKNNGKINASSLPTSSTGVGTGDVWSQNGTLRIGSATANIQTVATVTVLTPNADTTKMEIVSALSNTLTIASPTGTPTEAQELTFRIKDNGTARLVVWDAIFEDYTGSLPSTTIANKTVYVGCKYNAIDTKWDVVAVQNQP